MPPIRTLVGALAALALTAPAAASANVAHTVALGESLSSVAAVNGLSVQQLAAANGLPVDAGLLAGATLQIPPRLGYGTPAPAPAAATSAVGSGYTVQPGDTLSGLAARQGVSTATLAARLGLSPTSLLIAGTRLGSGVAAAGSTPAQAAPAASTSPTGATRVTSGQIAAVASRNGVPSSLASAIAWQESGFNNTMVSSTGARGVMQVMPGTWRYVQQNLARRYLNPTVPVDNVGAGVLYLGDLLHQTGGDQATATAAYYQGLSSVRRIGLLPDTRAYVDNVLALKGRFGG